MVNSSASDAAYSSDDDASYDLIDAKGVQQDLKQLGDVLADFQASLQHTVTRIVEEKLKGFDARRPVPVIERQEMNVKDSVGEEEEDEEDDDDIGAEEGELNQEQETETIEVQEVGNNVNVEQSAQGKVSAKQVLGSIVETLGKKRVTFAHILVALAVLAAAYYFLKPSISLAEEMAGRWTLKGGRGSSKDGMYVRAITWKSVPIDAWPKKDANTMWYIHEHQGKVFLQSRELFPKVMSALPDGTVGMVDVIDEGALWIPLKKANGQWCLKSSQGKYLRVTSFYWEVELQTDCKIDEDFSLESW